MADGFKVPHKFHPDSVAFLELRKRLRPKKYHEYESLPELRQALSKGYPVVCGEVEYDGTREEIFVPSPHVQGGIPVYVYRPEGVGPDPAIFVYFHGGGMVLGERDSVDTYCRIISKGANCIVLNVEYRLAPEFKFPASYEDAETVAEWTVQNKTKIGGNERSKVGVGGDSAGGSLSASIAHDVAGLEFQVLIYPHVMAKYDYSLVSYQEYRDGPVLEREVVEWFMEQFLSRPEDARDIRAAPYLREKFNHLPPALFLVAQCDILREDSYEYAKKLTAAGVENELALYEGAIHAFYTCPGICPNLCKAAHDRTIEFIKKFQPSNI